MLLQMALFHSFYDSVVLLLGRKVIINLDSIFKSRDITLPGKVCLVKAMAFPAVMYECEIWTVKKSEWKRSDAFELWCWRRLLRVLQPQRRSKHSILKEIRPWWSLEGMMLKLKLQFGHLMWRVDSLEKSQLFASGGQSTGVSALASFLPKKSQGWSPSERTGWIFLQSKGLSQESSPTPQFKSINSSALSLLHSPTLTSIHDYWKNHSLD